MKEKRSFRLYLDYWQWFRLLTYEEMGKLLQAVFAYEENRTLPLALEETTEMAFYMIKQDLDSDREKYEAICRRNRENAKTRWQKQQDI